MGNRLNTKLRIATIVGTRPELIRLSRIISLFDTIFDHTLIHTGQNYDYELNGIFYDDLEIRKPDYYLDVDVSSFGTVIGETIIKSEKIFRENRPDALLVLGDTNSSLASIVAKRMHIPVFHMEAGNRSFDLNVPEEINRRLVDQMADFNLVYTSNSRQHLLSEGFQHRRIIVTGSPMKEVLDYYSGRISKSTILESLGLKKNNYFVVSVHREENVDISYRLEAVCEFINLLAVTYNRPVVVSLHPRTKSRIRSIGGVTFNPHVKLMKPFAFTDYICLQSNANCTVSDSGTVSEESSIIGFPAVTIRNSMERPEALDSGTILLSGIVPDRVLDSVRFVINQAENKIRHNPPPEYLIPDVSWKVAGLITGLSHQSNKWSGIYERES